jgi:hypothetical protein
MSKRVDLNQVRQDAVARIDRSERNFKLTFLGAAIVEAMFLVSFLLLSDLSNRMHVLLLISSVSTYTIVILGLVALGTHINRSVLRVLKAIELLRE